jgi:hypothetical protein
MAATGHNEGFRILDEFSTQAIPVKAPVSASRGVNPGMGVVAEIPVSTASADRIQGLRAMSNAELLAFIRSNGGGLTSEELEVIHDIAAQRWTEADAVELSREAMRTAVTRRATAI